MHANSMNYRLLHAFKLHLILYVLVLLLQVTTITMSVDVRCIDGERLALLELKQGFLDLYGYDWLSTWGYGEHQKECCNWTGVQCSYNTNHVVLLDLHARLYYETNASLHGMVAPSLSKLDHLTYLDLSYNEFNGAEIPKSIGSLFHLRYLNLSLSNFGGTIPPQLGNLSNLQYLDFSENDLFGVIPNSLGSLSNLQYIDLASNSLTTNLEWLPNLTSLQTLSLGYADLGTANTWTTLVTNNLTHLKKLVLNYCNLVGNIPEQLGALFQLQYLDLSKNSLTGILPHQLGNLSRLQFLHLNNNKFNGTLDDGIGQLSNLEEIIIGSNPLQGTITEHHFSKLSKLVHLDMSNTSMFFNISKSWLPPFQLEELDLSYSKIGPHFPEWLKNQISIQYFSLSHSEIMHVPDWLWTIVSGSFGALNLSGNKIQGEIANMPIQFSYDYHIDLSANQLRGEIPRFLLQARILNLSTNMLSGSSICSMTNSFVEVLDISYNKFSGELPADCWLHYKELSFLDMSFNNISGEVPAPLFSLPYLRVLHLRNNKFRSIPSMFSGNPTNLLSLDLSQNEISGIIPSWIGDKVLNLDFLSLRNNNFYGSLPFNICKLTQIRVFDLSSNHLSGSIPNCFHQFIVLSDKSFNEDFIPQHENVTDSITITWKGELNEYSSNMILQRFIDLSNNQLTGEIPWEMMDLVQLHSLNLSRNKLRGEINPKIGQLHSLEILDLSRNQLHGPIPSSIAQLLFLDKLNLSFNKLSGEIPIGPQLQTLNDPSIYYGNPELCGPPLGRMCPDDRKDNGKSNVTDRREDENSDDLFEMYGFYIFMAFGFMVGFWTWCGSLIFFKEVYLFQCVLKDLRQCLYKG